MPVLLAWGERDPVFHLGLRRRPAPPAAAGGAPPLPARRAPRRRGGGRGGARRRVDRARLEPSAGARRRRPLPPRRRALVGARRAGGGRGDGGRGRRRRHDLVRRPRAAGGALAEGLQEAGVAPGDGLRCSRPSRRISSPPHSPAGRAARRGRRRPRPRSARPRTRAAERRAAVAARNPQTLGAARLLRWAPTARPLEIDACAARRALSAVVERLAPHTLARPPPSSSPRARPGREGRALRPAADAAQFAAVRACYGIGPTIVSCRLRALRAVRARARHPGRRARLRHHKPGSLRAGALADACAAIGATIVFAAPAALEGVLASREGLSRRGRGARVRCGSSSRPGPGAAARR